MTLGKLAATAIQVFKLGNGTTVPGRVALAVYPALLQDWFACQIIDACGTKVIAVTGTNGKTTTAGMLAAMLGAAGHKVCHNTLGANMLAGITSALVLKSTGLAKFSGDTLVLEVDEANLPLVTARLPIHHVVVTNLFRDQLDRYGELDTTARFIADGIKQCQLPLSLYLNAHDERILAMAKSSTHNVVNVHAFGMTHTVGHTGTMNDLLATVPCRFEAAAWDSQPITLEGMKPTITEKVSPIEGGYEGNINGQKVSLPVDGLYNVMNATAAMTVATALGCSMEAIQQGLASYTGVFGRSETLTIEGRAVKILLIKNPVGATEICRMVAADPKARLMVALNDNDADGRDVSWIWDAAFELLNNVAGKVFCAGKRGADMAVRLKYAGLDSQNIVTESNPEKALLSAIRQCPAECTLYALVTYTNLLALRSFIAKYQ